MKTDLMIKPTGKLEVMNTPHHPFSEAAIDPRVERFNSKPPVFPPGVNGLIVGHRIEPDWLKLGPEFDQALRHFRCSNLPEFPVEFWIKTAPGAKGQIVLAVGEGEDWGEPGQRLMDVLVEGSRCATGVDPVTVAGGKHRIGAILCEAEDADGDGLLHIMAIPSEKAPLPYIIVAGLWWIANGTLTPEQARQLVLAKHDLHPDVFVPGASAEEAELVIEAKRKRAELVAELKRQGAIHKREGLAKLPSRVRTESDRFDKLAERIYGNCIFDNIKDPCPPNLPNIWFNAGGCYIGQWIWDQPFGLNIYAAMDENAIIRGVFDNYRHIIDTNPDAPKGSYRYGMVPNHIPPVGGNWINSQQPNLAWGCLMVYRQTNDRQLLEECLPWLLAFDEWYSTERDVDGDGLIEFGSYNGEVQSARFETFDFSPPMDHMKMTRHPRRAEGGEWYGNVEGMDITCYLLLSERALVEIARALGREELARHYEQVVARRIEAIQQKMWDPERRFFFSIDRDTHEKIPGKTIQGFFALTAGAATPEQAAMLVEQLQDPRQWWSAYPVPTVALDDPAFEANGMWRGDMWPPTTYMVSQGLKRYGYHDVARKLTDRMLELYERGPIKERYDATTGEPHGVTDLNMSCAVWSMIVENRYGVDEDYRTIRIPPDAKGRRLLLGELEVSYPENETVTLRSGFDREFTVVFPTEFQQAQVTCAGKPVEELSVAGREVRFQAVAGRTYEITVC